MRDIRRWCEAGGEEALRTHPPGRVGGQHAAAAWTCSGRTHICPRIISQTDNQALLYPVLSSLGAPASCRHVFSVVQIFNLSVSVQIVAGRDVFAERGSVSRSTLRRATDALALSKGWPAGKGPAGRRPALLWLRLRRDALYRRFAIGRALLAGGSWQVEHILSPARRRRPRREGDTRRQNLRVVCPTASIS